MWLCSAVRKVYQTVCQCASTGKNICNDQLIKSSLIYLKKKYYFQYDKSNSLDYTLDYTQENKKINKVIKRRKGNTYKKMFIKNYITVKIINPNLR